MYKLFFVSKYLLRTSVAIVGEAVKSISSTKKSDSVAALINSVISSRSS